MNTRKARKKRFKYDSEFEVESDRHSNVSSHNDGDIPDEVRKERIRDSNREFAKRMTILDSWSEHWTAYSIREGEAYPLQEAKEKIKRHKKITCPIESCGRAFTTVGGLRYHYARCNIERCFKCLVCSPHAQLTTRGELLRHMILNHYDELPSLSDEQKVIANSYLSCENRAGKSKKEGRLSAESENVLTCQQLIKAFFELREKIYDPKTFNDQVFKDWTCPSRYWDFVSLDIDRRRYYPPERESVKFKSDATDSWLTLKAGTSSVIKTDKQGSPVTTVFNAGGVVTSSAWLPKSPLDKQSDISSDLLALSVESCSMNLSHTFKDCSACVGCLQFWVFNPRSDGKSNANSTCYLKFMVGHNHGTIFQMKWCPMGTSWQPHRSSKDVTSRLGLLALSCGDGQIRIISVPHVPSLVEVSAFNSPKNIFEATPMFRVQPVAILMAPNIELSIECKTNPCKSIDWNIMDNQRLILGGYANGNVALFDLSNLSPILHNLKDETNIYQPIKSWVAHGAPVTSVAISSSSLDRTFVATGSFDRSIKIWDTKDLGSCLAFDRAPVTKIHWDYRYRGLVSATDNAFTSFLNRVSYKHPLGNGTYNVTISTHRSTVWGLDGSLITGSIATSDAAGELFIAPQMTSKSSYKRPRGIMNNHSLFTVIPRALGEEIRPLESIRQESVEENLQPNESSNKEPSDNEESYIEPEGDFSTCERPVTNGPAKFLLPLKHRPVETYEDFKEGFGLEFVDHGKGTELPDSKIPESCRRAGDPKLIFCDRPCDYPFSSIESLAWSPNPDTFSHLLSVTHIGLCRIDRVQIMDQIFGGHMETLTSQNKLSSDCIESKTQN